MKFTQDGSRDGEFESHYFSSLYFPNISIFYEESKSCVLHEDGAASLIFNDKSSPENLSKKKLKNRDLVRDKYKSNENEIYVSFPYKVI